AASGWGTQDATGAGYDSGNTDNAATDASYNDDASGGYDDGGGDDDQA
ncbi:MAG: hypothetical protein JWR00_3790, partial [Rubritepida sp.]|nr:hypothetical protein [Rubritepida sp.]